MFNKYEGIVKVDHLSDISAERSVLAGLFEYGQNAYLDIIDFLQVDTFTDQINQQIFKCLKYAFDNKNLSEIDIPTILGISNELGIKLDNPLKLKYISVIYNSHVAISNIRTWASKIRKLHIVRLLKQQLSQAGVELDELTGNEPVSQILGSVEERIFNFSSLIENEDSDPQLLGEGLEEYLDYIEKNPVDIVGISSGFPYYDQAIGGGFRRGIVSLLSARVKSGKSVFCINIALHIAKKLGIPVLYLDTEMITQDQWARLLANLSYKKRVTITEIETGQYAKNNHKKIEIRKSNKILNEIPLWYKNVTGKEFEEIISIMRRWVHKTVGFDETGNTKNCLIIYDYFHLGNADKLSSSLQEYQMLGYMLVTLKNFAIRYNLPIFCTAQSNRAGIDKETTSVLAGSDRVLWTVANYALWKEKNEGDLSEIGEEHGNQKLIPLCTRHGEGLRVGDYINFYFHKKYALIKEGETRSNVLLQKTQLEEKSKNFNDINSVIRETNDELS